jgi:hypothetical protein
VGSCAHGDELSGSIRWGKYLEKMKKFCVSFSGRPLLHVFVSLFVYLFGWLVSWLVS